MSGFEVFAYLLYSFFILLHFLPAIVLILIPNRIKPLIITVILLLLTPPYSIGLQEIYRIKIMAMGFIIFFPALLMKILAIWANSTGKSKLAKLLPFIGLIGPTLFLFYQGEFEKFFGYNN